MVRENENADHLDLLAGSCLMLARFAAFLTSPERQTLGRACATSPKCSPRWRARSATARPGNTLPIAHSRSSTRSPAPMRPPVRRWLLAVTGVRMVATDLMVFAGVDLDDAVEAVREGILEQRVTPAPIPGGRFHWLRRLVGR